MWLPNRRNADAAVQVVWLFGHPIGHSLSPTMQNAAFLHAGLALRYVARDVGPGVLAEAIEALHSQCAKGANVTVPHKQAVLSMLDEIEQQAATIGAVNTIVHENGRLKGHNTDVGGFRRSLETVLPGGANGRKILVLGAGGAARAVLAALQQDEASLILVANRTMEHAQGLCQVAGGWGPAKCAALGLDEVETAVADCTVIVNATSLGMVGSVKELPIDVDILKSGQVLVDLVYGADDTALVKAARGVGLVAIDGREMLVQQAALSFKLWTGLEAPVDVMRGSLIGG